jgi:hypothetical protein
MTSFVYVQITHITTLQPDGDPYPSSANPSSTDLVLALRIVHREVFL